MHPWRPSLSTLETLYVVFGPPLLLLSVMKLLTLLFPIGPETTSDEPPTSRTDVATSSTPTSASPSWPRFIPPSWPAHGPPGESSSPTTFNEHRRSTEVDIYSDHRDRLKLSPQLEKLEMLLMLCEVTNGLLETLRREEIPRSPALGLLEKAERDTSSLRSTLQSLGSFWNLPA